MGWMGRSGYPQLASLCGPRRHSKHSPLCIDWYSRDEYSDLLHTETVTACASSPCVNNGTCIVDDDGFRCECAPGWYGHRCGQSK